ncbi:MAG: hypothetical protein DRN30_01815 [Thermoplasmata archaeon]|nr:MAG: hypothetical protein DRN30_01815 [Thermoplasmata archaeon]
MIRTIIGVAGIGTTTVFTLGDIQGLGSQVKITKMIAINDTASNAITINASSGLDTIALDTGTGSASVTAIELSQHGLRDNRGVHSISVTSATTAGKYYMTLEDNVG